MKNKRLYIIFCFILAIGVIIIMNYNIQMQQRNSDDTDWDIHYPITKVENVITANGNVATELSNIKTNKADKTELNPINTSVSNLQTQIASVASGSPKGTYATLTALQAAYPTGNTNIYVVTADGKWYYWSGTTWTAGGTYQGTGIADGSITATKTDFMNLVPGKNLFNKSNATHGYYVSPTTGQAVANSSFNYSEYIPIAPSSNYYTNHGWGVAYFDSNKAYISGQTNTQLLSTPANASYMVYSVSDANINTAQIELGTSFTGYEAYKLMRVLDDDVVVPGISDGIKVTVITVGMSGGDYSTIKAALNSITDASKENRYEIHVKNGTYTDSITTKNFVDIIGQSRNGTIIDFHGDPAIDINSQGAVYATSTSIIKNLTIKNIDGKYPIHSDLAVGAYELIVENCMLINYGDSDNPALNGCPFGIGLYANQHITIRNSELIGYNPGDTSGIPGVFCHNSKDGSGHRSLRVENCKMSDVAYGLHLQTLDGTVGQMNDCYFEGNIIGAKVADILYNDIDNTHAWQVHASGNNIRRVLYENAESYIIEEPGFTRRIWALTRNINKGEVVTIHSGVQYGYGITTDSLASPLVQGVALQDIAVNTMGVIQIAGTCDQVKVNGIEPILSGDTLNTYTELGIAQKGTINAFAIALQPYNLADSKGLIKAWLIPNCK